MSTSDAPDLKHTPVVPLVTSGYTRALVSDLRELLAACRAEGMEITPDAAAELLAADRRLRAAYEST